MPLIAARLPGNTGAFFPLYAASRKINHRENVVFERLNGKKIWAEAECLVGLKYVVNFGNDCIFLF